MKNGIIAGLLMACLGFGLFLASREQLTPAPVISPETHTATQAPIDPAPPVELGRVVEVTDIDPLLDPPARPVTGALFDPEPEAVRVSVPTAPDRIPTAVD